MKQIILVFFFFGFFKIGYSQVPVISKEDYIKNKNNVLNDSLYNDSRKSTSNVNIKNENAKIVDYLIVSRESDTTYVDTTLTIQKEYKYNYLRKDNFGLMPFSNVGQTYNSLYYNFESSNLMPSFGARARHFNYMEIEDIKYYHVPTPLTELYFKTAFEQGQQLDAFFTTNINKQINFSIAYKGIRSLGKYQHILTSTGNFRFTTSYKTKNDRYVANAHIVMQDLLNEENGGVTDDNIQFFESGDPAFIDRGVLNVNFEDAENILEGKRFHLDHAYHILRVKDSLSKNSLSIGHIISFEDKFYEFRQTTENEFFGSAFKSSNLKERVTLENFYNQLQLNYSNSILGDLQFNTSYNDFNYGYDKVVVLNNSYITNRLKGNVLSVGGKYHKKINRFELNGELGVNVSGDFDGNFIFGKVSYAITDDILASAIINHSSKAPNYNYLLYQSEYINYNWQNNFNNIETEKIGFKLQSKKLANISVDYTTISDYTYFKKDATENLVKPFQNDNTINYLQVKLDKEIKFGKFGLENTLLYQNVQDDNQVLNVPEFITRNTLYYSNHFFKRAMFLQTGITFNYFTKYNMNAYDPLLAEFYVQTDKEYGGFPRFDVFVNVKISQVRIFLKAEHVNSAWTGYDFYSAPNNPYRDFVIRFGLVWNFFL